MELINKNILVIGGAGFIGSACVRLLSSEGYNCVVFDNLESGREDAIDSPLIIGDIRNRQQLNAAFKTERFDAVVHLAAKIMPTESLKKPKLYHEVNTQGSINVGQEMLENGVRELIFSSTAAVYGEHPDSLTEETACRPTTPYGLSKKRAENHLLNLHDRGSINLSILRFFNAAGAMPESNIGETYAPEIHLIPKIIRSVKTNTPFSIYGNKHPTHDGTCIRDYVHVLDIAKAHCLLMKSHFKGNTGDIFNVGSGSGHSVMQVYNEVIQQMESEDNFIIEPQRDGDPSILVTDISKLKETHNWYPLNSNIQNIVKDAIKWSERITS